jgi:WD40 repeat protein
MILIHFPVWVTLYFIEPQEFANKHSMRKIACFDVNDEKVVALAGPSAKDPKVSRIIVKSPSSDAYLFQITLAASVEGIALSQKGDMVAVCSDATVKVWDIASM